MDESSRGRGKFRFREREGVFNRSRKWGEVETIDWSGGYIKVSNGGVGRVRITESTGL